MSGTWVVVSKELAGAVACSTGTPCSNCVRRCGNRASRANRDWLQTAMWRAVMLFRPADTRAPAKVAGVSALAACVHADLSACVLSFGAYQIISCAPLRYHEQLARWLCDCQESTGSLRGSMHHVRRVLVCDGPAELPVAQVCNIREPMTVEE
jgi:hypothetical protein